MPASKARLTDFAEMSAWERAREMFMSGLGVLLEKYNHSLFPSTVHGVAGACNKGSDERTYKGTKGQRYTARAAQ